MHNILCGVKVSRFQALDSSDTTKRKKAVNIELYFRRLVSDTGKLRFKAGLMSSTDTVPIVILFLAYQLRTFFPHFRRNCSFVSFCYKNGCLNDTMF